MAISGTIIFSVLLLWVIPKDQISSMLTSILILAIFLYGSCAFSLLIRSKINKNRRI
jgi:hypothetical protein